MTGDQRLWGLQHPTADTSEPVLLSPDSRRRTVRLGVYTFAAIAILNVAWIVVTDASADEARFCFEAGPVVALLSQFLPNPRVRAFGRGIAYCAFGILIVGGLGAALLWSVTGVGGS